MPFSIRRIVLLLMAAAAARGDDIQRVNVTSPDGKNVISVTVPDEHLPVFTVARSGRTLIEASPLNIVLAEKGSLTEGAQLVSVQKGQLDETFTLPWGKTHTVRNHCSQKRLRFKSAQGIDWDLCLRAYDDGVAFRYELPKQADLSDFVLAGETTEFRLAGDPSVLFTVAPSFTTPHETLYEHKPYSALPAEALIDMPFLAVWPGGVSVALTEAALIDHPDAYLERTPGRETGLRLRLSPLPGRPEVCAIGQTPHVSPWRVVFLADQAGKHIESNLLVCLNDPPKGDFSWVKPGKTTWHWWNGTAEENMPFTYGMNFETHKYYIDFCARHGIAYHAIVADDKPWYKQSHAGFAPGPDTDITQPREGLELQKILAYAKRRGVGIRLWVHWAALNKCLEEAFSRYEDWGIKGLMVDFLDRDDQEMVQFCQRVPESAARHKLTIQFHGSYKPSGEQRRFPNLENREGVLNLEYLKWGNKCTPQHNVDVAYTRSLAGLTDYHLGGFHSVSAKTFKPQFLNPHVIGTRCHHLALYVVYDNLRPMVADAPTAYEGQTGFEFIADIPVTWDQTRFLTGEPGQFVVVARRRGNVWYLGGITNATARQITVPLDMLDDGPYKARLFVDGSMDEAKPNAITARTQTVTSKTPLKIAMASGGGFVAAIGPASETTPDVTVGSLIEEMVDFDNLAKRPEPFFKEAMASSYDRKSHEGRDSDAWFANYDVGQYVRTETTDGRKEHVLADLKGPGTITRFWSANPKTDNVARFYFDDETKPRIEVPLADLFNAKTEPFGPDFSYISATGGNLYYPIPFGSSLKITVEEKNRPLRLYYEIGYRIYDAGTVVETFDPGKADTWRDVQSRVARKMTHPEPAPAPAGTRCIRQTVTVRPGQTTGLSVDGERAVYSWSARVLNTKESLQWDDPKRAHNAYRFLTLNISFDGQESIATPLGDFFGSGPGVNPYENLFFTVSDDGRMTSRLLMPFNKSIDLDLTNGGQIPYTVEIEMNVGPYAFTDRSYHLRAQWGRLTRESWPPFDMNVLNVTGQGKVIGSVYELANDALIWWGEGDQKIAIDGEPFPSTFGTGTEDDYGYAYGNNRPFTRPYHAQTRVDGPASGGHISLNRWYVLDALPYRKSIRFDQEVWHWMPCKPTWSHVIYWYAAPGSPGPVAVDRDTLAPVDLGVRQNMLDPIEAETLPFEVTGGKAENQRLANCSRARQLFWHDAEPGQKLIVHFNVPKAGRYSVKLNLCMSPDYGRQKLSINGVAVDKVIDCYSPKLYWQHPQLGVFDLKAGDNTLEVEALQPNPKASSKNQFGLDYIFLIRQ